MIRVSSLKQAQLCPGSLVAQEGLPDSTSAISEAGTAIHDALCGKRSPSLLSSSQKETYDSCVNRRNKVIEMYVKDGQLVSVDSEEAYSFGEITGHPDLIEFHVENGKSIAVLFDYKTGWIEVDEPALNLQLRGYTYLLFKTYDTLEEVICAIIQPTAKESTPCVYTRAELPDIEAEITSIIDGVKNRSSERNPSEEACRYCKAFGTQRCPETESGLALLPTTTNWLALSPDDKGKVLDACALAEKLIKKIRDSYKMEVDSNPNSVTGYGLKSMGRTRNIEDVQMAFDRLSGLIEPEQFVSCCKLSVTKLEQVIGHVAQLKGKALRDKFNEYLGDLIEETPKEPSLKKL